MKGISKEEQKLAKTVIALGPSAIPRLLPLLKHSDKNVRDLTSYILSDTRSLTAEHLDALIASRLTGDRWIPPAIARIGTPKAIKFLVEELKKEKRSQTQLTYAFKLLSDKGIPYLVDLYVTEQFDGEYRKDELLNAVNSIFQDLGEKAKDAVDPLVEIASNEKLKKSNRLHAIAALGAIGPAAHRIVPALQKMAEQNLQGIKETVERAIIQMRAPESANILVRNLEKELTIYRFRDIADMGRNGKSAGPDLIKYLNHEDWEIRLGAARVMGYIGYDAAVPHLMALLKNTADWRLVYVAIKSLGELQSKEALALLMTVSKTHWFPLVKDAATEAIWDIENPLAENAKYYPENSASGFFDYETAMYDQIGAKSVEFPFEESVELPFKEGVKIKNAVSTAELKQNSYQAGIHSSDMLGRSIIKKITQIPDTGIKVENGYIVGSSRGEWGGELMFVGAKDGNKKIIEDNITAIYRTPSGIVAVAGLAHLSLNWGGSV